MKHKILLTTFSLILTLSLGNFEQISAQIKGKLLKSDGKALAYTEIEMVPIDADKIVVDGRMIATSSTSGLFLFNRLPKGKYTLSVNFKDKPTELSPFPTHFYPNTAERKDATVFEITDTSKPQTIIFRLPSALVRKKVSGNVVWENGNAVENAFIFVKDIDFDESFSFGQYRSDKKGAFTFTAFASRNYQVGAVLFDSFETLFVPKIIAAAESQLFKLETDNQHVKLVFGERKDYDRFRDKYIGILEKSLFEELLFNSNSD